MNAVSGNKIILVFALATLLGGAAGCDEERRETPTKGYVTVAVSESVQPVMELERRKFEEIYPQAHVTFVTGTTRAMMARFFNDTIKVIISARPFDPEERAVAEHAKMTIGEYKVAIDAVAIIVNDRNSVTQLRTTQLDSIFRGVTTRWKDVGGPNAPIELCLPDPNSANFEVVGMKVLHGARYAKPAKLAADSPGMLDLVSKMPNAIGMVGVNWLQAKKENVRVLELMDPAAPDSLDIKGQYFGPHPAHVYRGYYPIPRDVYIYSRTDNYGPAAGFLSFVASAPGQKIIVNNGLVPATMPVRLVELTRKGETP